MLEPESEAKVLFKLFGEEFPLEEVTKTIGMTPTEFYQTGDVVSDKTRDEPRFHKETVWTVGTDYEKTFDVKVQLDKILVPLLNKAEEINKVKKEYGIDCLILVVLIIEKGETPAMYLEKQYIEFGSRVGAEIQWDMYANPYISDF